MDAHTEYHKAHGECCDEEIGFEPGVLCAEEVYPDAGYVAAEEEVFGEGRIVRVDGILKEEIAEGDDAGGGLEGYHEDTGLAHYGNKKVHLDDAEDGEGPVDVGDDEGEQRGVKQQEYMGRKVEGGEEGEQGIIQMDAGAGLDVVAYALRNGRVGKEEAGCEQYL